MCIIQLSFAQTETLVATAEAEKGVLAGGLTIATTIPGFSGTGYVTNFRNATDKVTVTVNVPTKAYYKLVIRYAAPNGKKNELVSVNSSSSAVSVVFNEIATFADADAGKYLLNTGDNTITLQSEWGWIEVDKFSVYSADNQKHTYNITTNLVNPNATAATKSLYSFLVSNFNVKIISGQTTGFYDNIKNLTGKSPMLRAFDFQHYTQGYSWKWDNATNGFSFGAEDDGQVKTAIDWYNSTQKKGIVNFHWHWHSPGGGTAGTNTFYTESTTFDITKAVISGSAENIKVIQDIDAIAVQLKRFQDADIPVLWRPLHEASGGWFWWGAKGAVACKQLYDIMYDRMTNYHHLNNLIWIWSSPEPEWYPGNDKIDIVGHDSYPGNYNYDVKKNDFDLLYKLGNGTKLIAMTENGPIPNIDDCLTLDAPWVWFMSWNELVTAQNTNQHIIDVFNNSNVLTLETSTDVDVISLKKEPVYQIFPNPAREKVMINGSDIDRLEVLDLNGRIVYSTAGPIHSFQTESFKNGLYIVKIYNNHTFYQQKLVVIHE